MGNRVAPGMKFRRRLNGRIYVARDQSSGSALKRAWRTECGSTCDLENEDMYAPVVENTATVPAASAGKDS